MNLFRWGALGNWPLVVYHCGWIILNFLHTVGTFTFQDIPLPLFGKVFQGTEPLEVFDPTNFAITELHSDFMGHDLHDFHWASPFCFTERFFRKHDQLLKTKCFDFRQRVGCHAGDVGVGEFDGFLKNFHSFGRERMRGGDRLQVGKRNPWFVAVQRFKGGRRDRRMVRCVVSEIESWEKILPTQLRCVDHFVDAVGCLLIETGPSVGVDERVVGNLLVEN